MSYYKIKSASLKKDGTMKLTAADSSLRPLTYLPTEYPGLEQFLNGLVEGGFQPLASCKMKGFYLNEVAERMSQVMRMADHCSWNADRNYGTRTYQQIKAIVVSVAKKWIESGNLSMGLTTEDLLAISKCNLEAEEAIEAARKSSEERRIIICRCARYCDFFEGYDALTDENGKSFLGKRERYDNRGHYDNADGSAIYLCEGSEEDNYIVDEFFGTGYVPQFEGDAPEIIWDEIMMRIPNYKATQILWERLTRKTA